MHKDLTKLTKSLNTQGFTHRTTNKGHLIVYLDNRPITTFSGTPSDHRSWTNSIQRLRRAGYTD